MSQTLSSNYIILLINTTLGNLLNKDKLITLIQFVAIGVFLSKTNINFDKSKWLLMISSVPAVWAFFLQNRFFSIYPVPKNGAKLIVNGPYRYIRHPMYTAIIFFCLIVLVEDFSYFLLVKYLFIISIIYFKIKREEVYLENLFVEYTEYKKKTKFIIPFVF